MWADDHNVARTGVLKQGRSHRAWRIRKIAKRCGDDPIVHGPVAEHNGDRVDEPGGQGRLNHRWSSLHGGNCGGLARVGELDSALGSLLLSDELVVGIEPTPANGDHGNQRDGNVDNALPPSRRERIIDLCLVEFFLQCQRAECLGTRSSGDDFSPCESAGLWHTGKDRLERIGGLGRIQDHQAVGPGVLDRIRVRNQHATLSEGYEKLVSDLIGVDVRKFWPGGQSRKTQGCISGAKETGTNHKAVRLDLLTGRRWEFIGEVSHSVGREGIEGLVIGRWI